MAKIARRRPKRTKPRKRRSTGAVDKFFGTRPYRPEAGVADATPETVTGRNRRRTAILPRWCADSSVLYPPKLAHYNPSLADFGQEKRIGPIEKRGLLCPDRAVACK